MSNLVMVGKAIVNLDRVYYMLINEGPEESLFISFGDAPDAGTFIKLSKLNGDRLISELKNLGLLLDWS